MNLKVSEKLLEIISTRDTVSGLNIFKALKQIIEDYNLLLKNPVSHVTVGAPAITGITKGLAAQLNGFLFSSFLFFLSLSLLFSTFSLHYPSA